MFLPALSAPERWNLKVLSPCLASYLPKRNALAIASTLLVEEAGQSIVSPLRYTEPWKVKYGLVVSLGSIAVTFTIALMLVRRPESDDLPETFCTVAAETVWPATLRSKL
ncbi:hypothetical protein RON38_02180 [Lactobacillus mulieris]|uniref:hypothetical protein n=1 Tax=Lactobacillus mulieris TaxID=2508708 RepID=UPI001432EFAA|nr:hypothetical protein [Lactobacillus mulieris]MDK6802989.1 hypothetical protein [Lactobacillus mulieris]MDK8382105.1 hypothetical protein [Lactobacillus mulieris]MDT9620321.1 hypothetical protein [Lactobacillus mulieris]NKC41179.1 hypothetical protein [Lactobacillus mulieris]